jgi:hypothetical protein
VRKARRRSGCVRRKSVAGIRRYGNKGAAHGLPLTRIERGQLRDEDAQLLARLLRLLLRLITLLQRKNASLSRLKQLLFGPLSDTRMKTNPSSSFGAEGESDSAFSTATEILRLIYSKGRDPRVLPVKVGMGEWERKTNDGCNGSLEIIWRLAGSTSL